jgi:hypothetical protein
MWTCSKVRRASGAPVRNVARLVIGAAYRVLEFVAREVPASSTIA